MKKEFLDRIKCLFGQDEYEKYVKSLTDKPKRAFRINSNKIDQCGKCMLDKFITKKIPCIDNSFYLLSDEHIGLNPYHHSGLFYMQEPSSMMPVNSLPCSLTGKVVLDLCASPGGKSGQLSEKVGINGFVYSNEVVPKRVSILRSNVERMGYQNIAITNLQPKVLCEKLYGICDVVLVDAPCSGEGMFRKDVETQNEWSDNNIVTNSTRQLDILCEAQKAVKSNGYIIYSTCTFSIEENELVVNNFLNKFNNYIIVDPNKNISSIAKHGIIINDNKSLSKCLRFYPQDEIGEGQFCCILQNCNITTDAAKPLKKWNNINYLTDFQSKLVYESLNKYCVSKFDMMLGKIGNQVVCVPNAFKDYSIPLVSCGVVIGVIENNVFSFHHNFVTAFGNFFRYKVDLYFDDVRVKQYLHGEQIFDDNVPDGFCVVCVDSVPLGLGKSKNGYINNHYPKGLRNK